MWFHFRNTLVPNGRDSGQGLPHIRLRGPWCKGCCRRTSPHRWRPGSAATCRSCRCWPRATPQTGGSCRWSSAWQRLSAVWGRSSGPCWWSFHLRQRKKANGGKQREKHRLKVRTMTSLHRQMYYSSTFSIHISICHHSEFKSNMNFPKSE